MTLKCRIIRSEPQEDGTFRTTLESDVPADSVTMHGDLLLVPVDGPVYQMSEGDPIMDKMATLRERFHWQASVLWARGMPPPTADEIADAMTTVLVEIGGDDE